EKRTSELVCGDLILDCYTRRASRGDHEMELTVKEYRLLEHFMNNQAILLSRVNLLKHVWDKNFETNTN
ncbi:winged helix-turn-helix domain-containing protein, partial [Bacteroides cellulosilyticus]|uniref:winged helix-turn-helix domain-containing protein n=1 Tax=Bacteroides cellulosilyticus TaxID=246787 RepID=UPI00210DF753